MHKITLKLDESNSHTGSNTVEVTKSVEGVIDDYVDAFNGFLLLCGFGNKVKVDNGEDE